MSESSNSAWPFGEIPDEEGLDIAAIFKDSAGTVDQGNPFASPVEAAVPAPASEAQEPTVESAEPALALEPAAARPPRYPRSQKHLWSLHPSPPLPRLRKSPHPRSRR